MEHPRGEEIVKRILFIIALLGLTVGCAKQQTKTEQPKKVETTPKVDNFAKKQACAAMLEPLRDRAEQDRFLSEVYARTFYSPKLDACVATKFTLYSDKQSNETMEILNLSTNQTIWFKKVECGVKPVGFNNPPVRKYTCSDYAATVELEIEKQVSDSHLEDE